MYSRGVSFDDLVWDWTHPSSVFGEPLHLYPVSVVLDCPSSPGVRSLRLSPVHPYLRERTDPFVRGQKKENPKGNTLSFLEPFCHGVSGSWDSRTQTWTKLTPLNNDHLSLYVSENSQKRSFHSGP